VLGKEVSKLSGNLRSIYAMLIAVFMFSLMDTAMKLLAADYPAMQVAALRSLSSLPLVCAYVAWRGGFRTMLRVRWSLQVLRALLGIGMLALFAYGLKKLSLAEAYTIFFIAPALITALSVFVLKEKVSLARWIAIAASGRRRLPDAGRPRHPGLGRVLCGVRDRRAGAGADRQQRTDHVLADADDGRRGHLPGRADLGGCGPRPCLAPVCARRERFLRPVGHHRSLQPWRSLGGGAF
jgi:uncharacterized membrane protein